MQISDVEDLTAIADKKAHKIAEELIPENVRHEVEVKSNSLKQKWETFKEQNPQAKLIISFFAAILTFSLFFLDLFTDINATSSIMVENEVWGLIMLVFLLFPFAVSMIGIVVYTYKKYGAVKALMLLPFLPFIQVLLDFTLPFIQLAGRCNLLSEGFYAFSVSYGAIRTLSESFLESFPQTVFQLYIFIYCNQDGNKCNIKQDSINALIMSITISILSIIWHILGTFLASKAMGVTYREYLITLAKMGGGLPLEPVRRNRIRVVSIDFNPDEKQFAMLMSLLVGEKQSSVEEIDFSKSGGLSVEIMKIFREFIGSTENDLSIKTLTYQQNEDASIETLNELGNGMSENTTFRVMNLGNNNFSSTERLKFVQFLTSNQALRELYLDENNIDSSGAIIIADAMSKNKGLETLVLSHNLIDDKGVEALFENMVAKNSTLRTLLLDNNKITTACGNYIAKGLEKNSSLKSLDLNSNQLKDDGIVKIASALSKNKTLNHLNLGYNDCAKNGADALGTSLSGNIALRSLIINECKLPIQDLRGLDDSITDSEYDGSSKTDIQLQKQGLGYFESLIISRLLSKNEATLTLNLDRNELKQDGCTEISKALTTNVYLQDLCLASNQIGLEGVKAISEALTKNKTLKQLDVSDNKLSKEGAEELANGLGKSLKTGLKLNVLRLEKNQIGKEGLSFMETYLKETETLERLDLLGNNIGPNEGSDILSRILSENKSIRELNLRYNKLAEGTSKIAKALEANDQMQVLILWRNDVDDDSAIAIADMLKKNSSLQHLDLQGNSIADEGMAAIGLALKTNEHLEEINLRFNHIGFEGTMGLAEGLKVNKTMHTIVLQDNFLDDAARNNLEAATDKVEFLF